MKTFLRDFVYLDSYVGYVRPIQRGALDPINPSRLFMLRAELAKSGALSAKTGHILAILGLRWNFQGDSRCVSFWKYRSYVRLRWFTLEISTSFKVEDFPKDSVYVGRYVEYVRAIRGDLTGRLFEEISSPVAVRWNTLRPFKRIQGVYDGGRFCLSLPIRAIPWKYPTRRTKEDTISLAVYRAE